MEQISQQYLPLVEKEMLSFIAANTQDARLQESMIYSIQAGGKRMRPLLMLVTVRAFNKEVTRGTIQVAAALEMIHTYSLIHDDLPAMDDDDLRRGKATNHKKFDEATAILAGDALLTEAFSLLSQAEVTEHERVLLIQLLAKTAGARGMVAGQAADMQAEGRSISLAELMAIHQKKTGELIRCALVAGGTLAHQSTETIQQLTQLAAHLGLAFQIRDDLLDVTASVAELGKNPQQDARLQKSTYPSLLGLAQAKQALAAELRQGVEIVQTLSQSPEFDHQELRALIEQFRLNDRK
ncbi:MAG: polyprenyl synthetase family protein [Enterococcus sp.]